MPPKKDNVPPGQFSQLLWGDFVFHAFQVLSRQKTAPQNFFLRSRDVEQGTGVEPAFTAWEAVVLPIYEPCVVMVL